MADLSQANEGAQMSDEKQAHHDSEDAESLKLPNEEEELDLPAEIAEDVKGGASTPKPAPDRFYIK